MIELLGQYRPADNYTFRGQGNANSLRLVLVMAGGEVGDAGVVAAAQDLVEFGRAAAEGRLLRGGVDDDDGYLGAFWDVDGAGEADDAVFVNAVEGLHARKPRVGDYSLFCVLKDFFRKLLVCENRKLGVVY
jgi:hypothetical protein